MQSLEVEELRRNIDRLKISNKPGDTGRQAAADASESQPQQH